MNRNIREHGYGVAVCAILIFAATCIFSYAQGPALDPFEPEVTRKEAAIIRTVMEAAGAEAGLAVLEKEKIKDDCSSALDLLKGNLFFQLEKLEDAAACYRKAVDKMPKYRQALMNLGKVYLLQDQPGKAVKLYQVLVRDGQADAEIMLLLGHALMMENHVASAENAYRHVLLLDAESRPARLGLIKALLDQERYAEGASMLRELLDVDSSNGELWSLLSSAYLALDRHEKAISVLECARRLNAASPEMLALLGDLYLNDNQPDSAVEVYLTAFSVEEPSVKRLLSAVEGLLMTGASDKAQSLIAKADDLQKVNPSLFAEADVLLMMRIKGELALLKGDADGALKIYSELLRKHPLDGRVLLLAGSVHHGAGRLEEALLSYERASRIKGFEAEALLQAAQVEIDRDNYGKAVELLENAQVYDERPQVEQYLKQIRRLNNAR